MRSKLFVFFFIRYLLELDHCRPDPCKHGICESIQHDYVCHCVNGYTGKDCNGWYLYINIEQYLKYVISYFDHP